MFRFFTEKHWFIWSWIGSFIILSSLWVQVEIDVKINEWFGVFYDMIQKALAEPNAVSIEEYFAKEFFEYNKMKPAPILSLDSDKLYGLSSFTQCCGHNWKNDFLFSPVQSKDKIYEDENYNNQYNYAKKSLVDSLSNKLPVKEILNLDKFGNICNAMSM